VLITKVEIMKRSLFISTFIGVHLFFAFFQVHKHSNLIKLSYQKQKHELTRENLIQKKRDLTQQLYALQDRAAIKEFAQQELKMEKVSINQVKKLSLHEQSVQV